MDLLQIGSNAAKKSAEKPKGCRRGRSFLKGHRVSGGQRPGNPQSRHNNCPRKMLDCETRPLLRGAIDDAKGGDVRHGAVLPQPHHRPAPRPAGPLRIAARSRAPRSQSLHGGGHRASRRAS